MTDPMAAPDLSLLEKETFDVLQAASGSLGVRAVRSALGVEVAAVFVELRKLRDKNDAISVQIGAVKFAEARAAQDQSPGASFNLGMARWALADAAMGRTPEPAPLPSEKNSPPNQPIEDPAQDVRDRALFRRGLAKGFTIRLRHDRAVTGYDDLVEFLEEIAKP